MESRPLPILRAPQRSTVNLMASGPLGLGVLGEPPNLNYLNVRRVNDTIFIPLPRELWRIATDGRCSCGKGYCAREGVAYWDTLAVGATKSTKGRDYTWTVHYPELHR